MELKTTCLLVLLFCVMAVTGQENILLDDNGWLHNKTQLFDDFSIQITWEAAELLQTKFKEISHGEMGVEALQTITRDLHSVEGFVREEEVITAIAEKIANKLEASMQVLHEMKRAVMNSSKEGVFNSFLYPCKLQDRHLENIDINSEKVMLNIPKSNCQHCARNLVKKYKLKLERQGFLSVVDDGGVRECRDAVSGSARRLLHHTMQTQSKAVLILLDNGGYMGTEGLHIAVDIIKEILNLLGPTDLVAFMQLDSQPNFIPLNDNCKEPNVFNKKNKVLKTLQGNVFSHATDGVKGDLEKYLSGVEVTEEPANITIGLELVQQALEKKENIDQVLVLYFGRQSSVTPQVKELEGIYAELIKNKKMKVMISGCSVPDILDYVAALQSYVKECPAQYHFCGDWLLYLNTSQSYGEIATHLLLKLQLNPLTEDVVLSGVPHWEPQPSTGALVPLYMSLPYKGLLFIEVYLSDLAEDILYTYGSLSKYRAFLIDLNGNVIAHSSHPQPEVVVNQPRLVHISDIENDEDFRKIKPHILQDSAGRMKGNLTSYVWRQVKKMYVVCLVFKEWITEVKKQIHPGDLSQELQHHRLDLLPPTNTPLCRHFLTVSTIHKGTLYLSPSSFASPFSYLYELRTNKDVSLSFMQKYMAYLEASILSNPGLKPDVKSDVRILNRLMSFYKERHIKGIYNKYIVRRYAATEHGVLVLFPGTTMESDFEPIRKAWFVRALRHPGSVILTPPYLDIGGAGYIITISLQSPDISQRYGSSVVLAVDITMRYLYKMVQEVLPVCSSTGIRCFLMDDRGYLLSHPGLVDPTSTGPIEKTHITHKEAHIVNDILNHRDFVNKKLCKNYAYNTLQRYYQFNTSLDRVLTNFVSGGHYARYHIAPIAGTNVFVGMINVSTHTDVFCPCSVENRLCLNCKRMEQTDCECPCECVWPAGECSTLGDDVPLCEFDSERNHDNNFYTRRYNLAPHLDSCFDFQCESYSSKQSCVGVLGCEWCEVDRDRETPLMIPFCTAQPHCFRGVLSAPTPYEVGLFGHVTQEDLSPAYSAVGPIVGCIVALCLILALAVYCYKQNLSSTESEEAFPTPQDTWPHPSLQMTHLTSEEDVLDERSGHQDQLLLAGEAPVSPYRILTGYKRPPTAGESDHGYSTMTPHDDSEHQAFALVEPPSSPSLSTPRSSATDLPMTILPGGKNNILAPVTVHRHMEAT